MTSNTAELINVPSAADPAAQFNFVRLGNLGNLGNLGTSSVTFTSTANPSTSYTASQVLMNK